MTIKFVCGCGKHLRARDEMAGRRSVCPRCGHPVGVPSGEPTHAGTEAAPLTPAERQRLAAGGGGAVASRDRVGAMMLALLTGRRSHVGRPPEATELHWYDFLRYPLHDWRLWVGPAALLTLLSAFGLLFGPEMVAKQSDGNVARGAPWMAGLPVLLVVGYPCSFLRHVLRAAAADDGTAVRWPGHTVGTALTGAVVWLVCFLAGPVLFAGLAAAYWVECGDPGLVDWLILAELGLLTVGYTLLVLAAVGEGGRLRDANPLRVIDLAHRLGWRAGAATLAGFALVVGHGLLGIIAAGQLHQIARLGVLLLGVCWVSGLFWATALFRLLGMWCHHTRGQAVVSSRAVP
jgi:hypothetical protein